MIGIGWKDKGGLPERDRPDHRMLGRTLALLVLCGALLFVPLVWTLFRLTVLRHDELSEKAAENQTRSTAVSPERGTVYDRNMNVLAASAAVENVFLDPNALRKNDMELSRIAAGLSELLGVSEDFILRQASDRTKYYQVLRRKIPEETAERVRGFLSENGLVGICLEPDTKRVYPEGSLAAQVLGFVNADNVGSEGLEARYQSELAGSPGKIYRTKGAGNAEMPYPYENYLDGEPGNSLILTLDAGVQAYLEKNLENAIAKYDVRKGAFGIVMNVNTGEILAMATLGSFDPNQYLEIYDEALAARLAGEKAAYLRLPEGTEEYEAAKQSYQASLTDARQTQWRNRCTCDGYEPGSTFKLITLASALEEGTTTLRDSFFCGGSTSIKGRTRPLNCWRTVGHGAETTAQALQNSCNVAFAQIGIGLGGEKFYEYVQKFGLTETTGIDLYGEAKGYFFRKELLTDENSYASLTSGAFGQTFKVTPLQMVRAVSAVVNGGRLLRPYLVSEVVDGAGETVRRNEPKVLRQVISEETSRTMCTLMESVVTEGTAKNGAVAGYRIGGKTGTSEKLDVFDENGQPVRDRIVSFVGVAPIDDPQYIVLAALDTPSAESGFYISGGQMAAPVVRDIFADILPYLGIPAEGEGGSVFASVPDVYGKTEREAAELLSAQGFGYERRGSGSAVTGQLPEAGAELPEGAKLLLYMGEEKPTEPVAMPELRACSAAEAEACLHSLGLLLRTKGAPNAEDPQTTVTDQSIAPGTMVNPGTTITAELTDRSLLD